MSAGPSVPERAPGDGYSAAGAGLMLRLAARIFSDAPACTPLPAAYVFGQTPDNEASALGAAAELIARGVTARLLIPESEPWGGYAGHEHWRRVLPSLGVPARCVATVPTPGCGNLNTLTEAESLAKVVAAEGWKDVLIVAPPFHLVRAFVTTASVVVRRLPAVRVYAAAGLPQPWAEQAVHSQGTLRAARSELLASEYGRLVRYCQQGDLLGPAGILDYLDRRDASAGG